MLNFDFLEKGLGIVSHFIFYLRSKFHCLIIFSFRFEMLGNICIAIVCFPGCDIISFEVNLLFRIKPFFYMTKKLRPNRNLENEKSIQGEIKYIFHHF